MAISLASIAKHTPKKPIIGIHADPGVGKSTFGASVPGVVCVPTEDGLGNLDVPAFPLMKTYEDVIDALTVLYSEEHDFRAVFVDSLDWLEPLIWARVCRDAKVDSIERLNFGKGYVEALTYWRTFFDGITALRDARDMVVILSAHSEVRRVEDPTLPSFETRTLKLHKRSAAYIEEGCDVLLYAQLQTNTVTEDMGFGNKRIRATTTGNRIMHTVGQPAFLAKNRYSLPSPLPLAWESLAEALGPVLQP